MSQIRLFLNLYLRPLRAFGPVIDEARLAFAVGIALLAVFAVQAPRYVEYLSVVSKAQAYVKQHPAPPLDLAHRRAPKSLAPSAAQPPVSAVTPVPTLPATPRKSAPAPSAGQPSNTSADDGSDDDDDAPDAAGIAGAMPFQNAAEQFIGLSPFHYFPPLISIAMCFVPIAILIVSLFQGLGRFTNVLFRDYLTLLVCGLLAWAAAYLPLGIVNFALTFAHPAWHNAPALWWGATLYFAILSICALRTLMGASLLHAAGAVTGAWFAGVVGVWMQSFAGNVTWYLASPCLLYYLWANVQGSFHSIGYGLSSRQRMKRNLETLTINPRDADAHNQLGMIYFQRRQYEPAAERFRKAIEIDPSEPDAWYQLGRIARLQGRYADALSDCQTAARLDDKHSGSEVWRELGVVQFLSGRHEAASYALEKFIQRREYDPEGQCWYGRALAALGDTDGARRAFATAVEAARTMPAPRKYQVRVWGTEANKELRALRNAAAHPTAAKQSARRPEAESSSAYTRD